MTDERGVLFGRLLREWREALELCERAAELRRLGADIEVTEFRTLLDSKIATMEGTSLAIARACAAAREDAPKILARQLMH